MLQHSYDVVDVEQSLGRLTPEVNVVKFALTAG